jgi:photosystem II stability/assembly factor-like uncharacterized protein
MNYKFSLSRCIVMVWLLGSFQLSAQEFYELMNDPSVPLEKVQAAAKQYYATHSDGKSSGYKPYKRWEYEQNLKRNSKGRVLTAGEVMNILEKRKAKQSQLRVALPDQPLYTELGPFRVAPTGSNNTTVGVGRITWVSYDPQNSAVIYTAGVGGIWKSTNGGTSWSPMSDHLSYYAYSVTVHPTNSNIVLAGFDEAGVFKSFDGGVTWSKTNLNHSSPRKIIYDPTNSNIVLVATNRGLYRSTNGGDSFFPVVNIAMNDIEYKATDPNIVYASGDNFYRSVDGGVSFTQITDGLSTSGRTFIGVTPANPNYVYLIQANGNEMGYIFRSSNSGVSFTTRLTAHWSNGATTSYLGQQAWHNMGIAVSPTNAEHVVIGGIELHSSTNGGTSFTQLTSQSRLATIPFVHADVHYLEWKESGIDVGSDGGIYKSTNSGASFTDLSSGLSNRDFYRLGGTEADPYRIACGAQDNGQSLLVGKGLDWKDWTGSDGMEAMIDHSNKDIIYGTCQSGCLAKTINGGVSTTFVNAPTNFGHWVTPMFMDPVNASTIYMGFKDVWKSVNGGNTWTQISNFSSTETNLMAATIAKSNNQVLYAAKEWESSLYVTQNGGGSWVNTYENGLQGGVNYISVHPSNANKVTVITNVGVFKSDNAGATWQNITYDLPDIGKQCVLYQNSPLDIIYAGLNNGIYYLKPGKLG